MPTRANERGKGMRDIELRKVFPNAWSDRYHETGGFLACIACGKKTSNKGQSQGVFISGGGGIIVHPDDYEMYPHEGGDMGWFPVGRECIKTLPAEFRSENPYEDKRRGV